MRSFKTPLALLATAVLVAACGGGSGAGNQASRVAFSKVVSFGDSLSDGGTYKVGAIASLGGGKFTVNGTNNLVWTERIAADVGAASCPAQTGLASNQPGIPAVAVVNNTSCFNYAQGSSRVSNVFAPNSATLQQFGVQNIGLLAVPVTTQIQTHLTRSGGSFAGNELVTVMAGGNDIFMNVNGVTEAVKGGQAAVGAAITAGWSTTVQGQVAAGGAGAVNAAATAAVSTMAAAGTELANLVKTQIVGKGAKYVVVVNLPDVSQTPYALATDAQSRALVNQMVTAFNASLSAGVTGTAGVIVVDAYTQGRDQTANPAQYSLSNVTGVACGNNALGGSSLACNSTNLVAGDTSKYLYADSVHPSPYGHQLLAQFVAVQMAKAGWL